MGFEILENHIALSASNNVKEICKPLEKLGVTYFSFVRSYSFIIANASIHFLAINRLNMN